MASHGKTRQKSQLNENLTKTRTNLFDIIAKWSHRIGIHTLLAYAAVPAVWRSTLLHRRSSSRWPTYIEEPEDSRRQRVPLHGS